MAGRSSGFAIGIGIQDGASAGLDAINRRIAAMHAPAERFNRSIAKFGEVTGINRAAEGLQTMGDRALGAARAVERMAGPMLSLTSLASIGGMAAMTRQWALAGNEISKTSNLLSTPVSRLSALRGAARLAGSSAELLDGSLKGLGDKLADANFHRAPRTLVTLLNEMHIGFQGLGGAARTGADALGDVADAVTKLKTPHAQVRLLEQLGISEDLLPLLNKGRKGLDEFLTTAQRTGGVMTAEMAANAKKMNTSWNELALTVEGVSNRIVDSWSGSVTKLIESTSHWIQEQEKLNPAFDRNVQAVMAAVGALGALRVAPWILRALGWLLPGEAVPLIAIGVGALYLPPGNLQTGENTRSLLTPGGIAQGTPFISPPGTVSDDPSQPDYRAPEGPGWWQRAMGFIGGAFSGGGGRARASDLNRSIRGGPRADAGNVLDAGTVARAKQVHDGLVARGVDSNSAWGFAGNAVQESRAMWNSQPGDMGAAHGLFMWRNSNGDGRLDAYTNRYHHLPEQGSLDESLDYAAIELKGREHEALANIMRSGPSASERAAAISQFWERPKDVEAEKERRGGIAERLAAMFPESAQTWSLNQNVPGPRADLVAPTGPTSNLMNPPGGANGSVQVDITLHGAPHGTTATVVASGSASASPLRIETSMPQAR